ncbi:teichoic acid ABC transporter permease, partial [Enterobacter mori]
LSIIPSYIVFSRFYGHIGLLIIVMLLCLVGGYHPTIYTLQLLLYIPFALILTMAISLVTSTLGVLIRDTQMIMQSLMRIIFFVSSILYLPTNETVLTVMNFNPIF